MSWYLLLDNPSKRSIQSLCLCSIFYQRDYAAHSQWIIFYNDFRIDFLIVSRFLIVSSLQFALSHFNYYIINNLGAQYNFKYFKNEDNWMQFFLHSLTHKTHQNIEMNILFIWPLVCRWICVDSQSCLILTYFSNWN